MSKLKIFENKEFGQVRTVTINDEPYFCMGDICKSLDITNVSDVKKRLKEDGVASSEVIDSLGRKQQANFISESNMYKLIFQSRKESAERFTDWVTSEVLPSIRKTGTYKKPLTALDQISLIQRATLEVNEKIDEVDKDLQSFKNDMPLMAVDTDRITTAKNIKAVKLLGGKQSNAYKDKSLRTKVYRDMEAQIWRQFGVRTYKAIKRNQCDLAVNIINNYELPLILEEEIADCNAQICMN